jgi:hypothetical protein
MKTIKTLSSFFQSSAIASRVFIPAIVMLIAAVALPMPAQELAPALLREDLHVLRESLEEGHSGLYRYTPKAEMDRAFERAESHLNHPMSWRQFYALVLPIVARIRCGHTHITPGAEHNKEVENEIPVLPLDVQIIDGRPWILRDYSGGEQNLQGAELIEVNGRNIRDLLPLLYAATPVDGNSVSGKTWRLGPGGGTRFQMFLYFLAGIEAPYSIVARSGRGMLHAESVAGLTVRQLRQKQNAQFPRDPIPDADFRLINDGDVAILTIRSFASDFADVNGKQTMKEFIEDCFRQMTERKTMALILDLRGNQGGEDERGLQLFSHLVSTPFRYYDKIIANHLEFKLSQYTERPVRLPESDFRKTPAGRYSSTAHPMLGIQHPRPPYFAGKVIALMDGGSFSATCDFLSALHAAKRATFLGTETAGDYFGNTSIQFAMVTLPNTRLDIRIPLLTVYLSRKNPSAKPDHGILPDIPIEPSIQDLLNGRDPAMERALGLARAGRSNR